MSKDSIHDVVKKSLEKYFKDLGEQEPSNVYEMVVFTVEKQLLEAVMERAQGNQSHDAEMLGINRNTLRKKLQQHGKNSRKSKATDKKHKKRKKRNNRNVLCSTHRFSVICDFQPFLI